MCVAGHPSITHTHTHVDALPLLLPGRIYGERVAAANDVLLATSARCATVGRIAAMERLSFVACIARSEAERCATVGRIAAIERLSFVACIAQAAAERCARLRLGWVGGWIWTAGIRLPETQTQAC